MKLQVCEGWLLIMQQSIAHVVKKWLRKSGPLLDSVWCDIIHGPICVCDVLLQHILTNQRFRKQQVFRGACACCPQIYCGAHSAAVLPEQFNLPPTPIESERSEFLEQRVHAAPLLPVHEQCSGDSVHPFPDGRYIS